MNLEKPTETELLRLARQLDSRALAQIYDQYSPELYRYAMRLLGNPSIAEDCVAEAFSRLLRVLAAGKGPRDHLRAYLYRIAHNWITDLYRREPPGEELDESISSDASPPEDATDQNMQRVRIRQAVEKLTPDQRQVIVLKFWQDWENEEIARLLGKPVGAVKSIQHRALSALQKHLQE
ncbi:MAG: sigma-70 family RNA polymerase sigma factor [Anaerolineales bacterium]|nr:hypothetical protein [Anaerolineae bacterium]MBL1172978.1 sigma-70 family RNA polymerase sigma factor [Chloroflexota bacterium]MCL4823666.1 sigma-70 family RNA polymerase sigma factor [Anaerolineales bacterium]MDL1925218.1 sigma-70 family RNA polymerase sigma factor [Anaerolineae bacterium AMX1]NOG76476.1 sigma-70 family RNA polymerase sigma factor [Chloroflexota bacterium]